MEPWEQEKRFGHWIEKPNLKFKIIASSTNPLLLEKGGILKEAVLAYETFGTLDPDRENVILLFHGLTGDSHAASHHKEDNEGWWEPLVGVGKVLDTDRFFIISPNVLGGCQGSTGPFSINPDNKKTYGGMFPKLTVGDQVRASRRLMHELGVFKPAAVIGGSLGGMQALEWSVSYPKDQAAILALAAPAQSSAQSVAYNYVMMEAIRKDPAWRGGDYEDSIGPRNGLALARALGMITYQTEKAMDEKFGLRKREGRFEVENYLHYQGKKLVDRFDPNSYLTLLEAMNHHNIGRRESVVKNALERINGPIWLVGIDSDILYPALGIQKFALELEEFEKRVEYRELKSLYGHDSFLIDFDQLNVIVGEFIEKIC